MINYRIYPKYLSYYLKKSILLPSDVSKILLDEWQTVYTLIRCCILLRQKSEKVHMYTKYISEDTQEIP